MIRAAKVAAGRRLELRVVSLPAGRDPAELLAEEGAEAMRERVEGSVPFVRFRVERELTNADLESGEGKDAAVGALRPVFAGLAPSALRDELLGLAADRLGVTVDKLIEWLAAKPRPGAGAAEERRGGRPASGAEPGEGDAQPAPQRLTLDRDGRKERAFLIQCLALPSDGRAVLAQLDPETELTVPAFRRAAKLLAEHAGDPGLVAMAGDDAELAAVIAELQVRAALARPLRSALQAELLGLQKAAIDRELATIGTADLGAREALANRRQDLSREEQRLVAETLLPSGDTHDGS
jgi:DNA primase